MPHDLDKELKKFHGSIAGSRAEPLEYGSDRYVPILQKDIDRDPILKLSERIDLAESESLNLLTGFRGNGKSTELRRLQAILREEGYTVLLVNMEDYLMLTKPLELGDFLLSLIAALADKVRQEHDVDEVTQGYFKRIWGFLSETEIEVDALEADADFGVANGKIALRLQRDVN